MASGTGSPCGACKFLRRRCSTECVFAPYFSSEQGPARFAAIHKVFGASNVSKLLLHVPAHERCKAVVTVAYEAQARVRDPAYGCVAHIFAVQHQVAVLQAELMQVRVKMAQSVVGARLQEDPLLYLQSYVQCMSPSLDGSAAQGMCFKEDKQGNRRAPHNELG